MPTFLKKTMVYLGLLDDEYDEYDDYDDRPRSSPRRAGRIELRSSVRRRPTTKGGDDRPSAPVGPDPAPCRVRHAPPSRPERRRAWWPARGRRV